MFLPGIELHLEWRTMTEIRDYVRQGGLDDEKILEGLEDFNLGEEFLVSVIEYVDGPEKRQVYFHRMNKTVLKLNQCEQ